jgi:hypothetical protein
MTRKFVLTVFSIIGVFGLITFMIGFRWSESMKDLGEELYPRERLHQSQPIVTLVEVVASDVTTSYEGMNGGTKGILVRDGSSTEFVAVPEGSRLFSVVGQLNYLHKVVDPQGNTEYYPVYVGGLDSIQQSKHTEPAEMLVE